MTFQRLFKRRRKAVLNPSNRFSVLLALIIIGTALGVYSIYRASHATTNLTVEGYKILMPGSNANAYPPDGALVQCIACNGPDISSTTANPFFFHIPAPSEDRIGLPNIPAGYQLLGVVCFNNGCEGGISSNVNNPTPCNPGGPGCDSNQGNSIVVKYDPLCNSGASYCNATIDIRWVFQQNPPPATPTPTPAPTPPPATPAPTPPPATPTPTPPPVTYGAPSTPGTLVIDSPTNSSLHLAWGASVPASGSSISTYQVLNSAGTVIASTTSTNATVSGLNTCSSYSFKVRAVNNQGTASSPTNTATAATTGCAASQPPASAPPAPTQHTTNVGGGTRPSTTSGSAPASTPDTTPPSAPPDFTAKLAEDNSTVNLTWRASNDDASGIASYIIERSQDRNKWDVLSDQVAATEYTDTATVFDTKYFYRVRAKDNAGNISTEALAEITTGKFSSNTSAADSTGLTSDDGVVSITIPSGALGANAVCAIVKNQDHLTELKATKLRLLAGPYMLACKGSDGSVIHTFAKPLQITVKGTADQDKNFNFKLLQFSSVWSQIKSATYNKTSRTFSFQSSDDTAFALTGDPKSSIWPLLLSILIPLLLGFIGFIYLRLRQVKQAQYEAYLKRKYYDL